MISMIESQDMFGFIDGTFPLPSQTVSSTANKGETDNPDYIAWKKFDLQLKAWITGTLCEEALAHGVGCETSKEVWNCLINQYAAASQAWEFHLTQSLKHAKKGISPLVTI
eukprot:TRINITY_DN9315_c1_g1_i1.p1 TRINITY_DN9315_c1_g1~~TRINITY_DN9315_c1_g1_i1.p1  ORF type:complete len:111 (+),score=14.66 TRINITY_DN9315_c1_g1_i1:1343-1675(+)